MKKAFILVSVIVVAISANVPQTHAVSTFDNTYHQTDKLELRSPYYTGTTLSGYATADITKNYMAYFLDPAINTSETYRTSLQNAMANGGYWGVSIGHFGDSNIKQVTIAWTENVNDKHLKFETFNGQNMLKTPLTTNNWKQSRLTFTCSANDNCATKTFKAYNSNLSTSNHQIFSTEAPLGTQAYAAENLFINAPIDYPDGYAGKTIPDTFTPKIKITSRFKVSIADMSVLVLSNSGFTPALPQGVCATHKYELKSKTTDYKETYTLKGSDIGHQFEVPEHDIYTLTVTPTSCGIPYTTLPEEYQPVSKIVDIKVDGTSYSFSGNDLECDENGNCGSEDSMEDCSIYGIDLIGFFGCHIRNFSRAFTATVNYLFIPRASDLSKMLGDTLETIKNSLGFLWAPFDLFIQMFNLIIGQTTNPVGTDCTIGTMSMFGSSGAPMKLCAWRNQFPQYWSLMQTAAQGGLALGVIYIFWRKVSRMTGNPIEGDSDSSDFDIDDYNILDGDSSVPLRQYEESNNIRRKK